MFRNGNETTRWKCAEDETVVAILVCFIMATYNRLDKISFLKGSEKWHLIQSLGQVTWIKMHTGGKLPHKISSW